MSTTAASGLLAIVVCALLQGNPLQVQVRLDGGEACVLRDGKVAACVRLPLPLAKVDPQAGRR